MAGTMSLETARAVILSHLDAADDAALEAGDSREAGRLQTLFARLWSGISRRDPDCLRYAADDLRDLALLYATRAATEEARRERETDGPPYPWEDGALGPYGNRSA